MDIHPFRAEFRKQFQAAAAFLDGELPQGFERAREGEVVRSVSDDLQAEVVERRFHGGAVDLRRLRRVPTGKSATVRRKSTFPRELA
jgi:hypothetical protein